jgi:hypothetical protein
MGVLACDRRGCENIMCDRCSSIHGYICNECFDELVGLGIHVDSYDFMDTPKPEVDPVDSFAFYNEEFKLR